MESEKKLARLVEKLGGAFGAGRSERQQYVRAVLAIADYLENIKPLDIYSDKFRILAAALNDLDDGYIRPVLFANIPSNRLSGSTEIWLGRALVAASLDARLLARQTRDEAASIIAREYPSLKALTTAKAKSLKTAALSWYCEFNGERVKNTAAMKVFRAVRKHLQECGSLGQKEEIMDVARHTLSGANRIALRLSPHS